MQVPSPSPFVASVRPSNVFDPECHVAFGDLFLEKFMSPLADEIKEITTGLGMPDRADQGWITLVGPEAAETVCRLMGVNIDFLSPGTGRCGMQVEPEALPGGQMDLYVGQDKISLGLPRTAVPNALSWFRSRPELSGTLVRDDTASVVRIAVMGPDARIFLRALDVPDDRLHTVGDHMEIEIIQEPIRVCRSDFAGPSGFDFVIPVEPFNMILGVFCSWAVRLELNLLPVGWNAVQQVARLNEA